MMSGEDDAHTATAAVPDQTGPTAERRCRDRPQTHHRAVLADDGRRRFDHRHRHLLHPLRIRSGGRPRRDLVIRHCRSRRRPRGHLLRRARRVRSRLRLLLLVCVRDPRRAAGDGCGCLSPPRIRSRRSRRRRRLVAVRQPAAVQPLRIRDPARPGLRAGRRRNRQPAGHPAAGDVLLPARARHRRIHRRQRDHGLPQGRRAHLLRLRRRHRLGLEQLRRLRPLRHLRSRRRLGSDLLQLRRHGRRRHGRR